MKETMNSRDRVRQASSNVFWKGDCGSCEGGLVGEGRLRCGNGSERRAKAPSSLYLRKDVLDWFSTCPCISHFRHNTCHSVLLIMEGFSSRIRLAFFG